MSKTSAEWWESVKADPAKLEAWLRRQYVGEIAAVNLLSEILLRFGSEASAAEWNDVHKVMCQEATHARWIKGLMDKRGIALEPNASAERRYWAEVLPHVTNFAEAMAAAFHAEHMRLARIRVIAEERDARFWDLAQIFKSILPHEEWHEKVFDRMRKGREMTRYHEKGLHALNLTLT